MLPGKPRYLNENSAVANWLANCVLIGKMASTQPSPQPVAKSAWTCGRYARRVSTEKRRNAFQRGNIRWPAEERFTAAIMSTTNDSRGYEPQPTPAPKTVPTSTPPSRPSDEEDAEYEELAAANKSLSAQAQSLSAQVVWLQRSLAENGMAKIAEGDWLDLRAIKRIIHRPGQYQITQPTLSDREPRMWVTWKPGSLLLCGALQPNEMEDLRLPLPSVRHERFLDVEPPPSGTIPPPEAPKDGGSTRTIHLEGTPQEQAWETYCQPWLVTAQGIQQQMEAGATKDEKALARAAAAEIQARRLDPEADPTHTLADTLAAVAESMRTAA